ncbi:hypothetical protein LSAT2_018527 [Lamellibrachia satsuma]|nr:hypothetical protein LSAT2_018527 [Lamellibrachia satsuma]
MDLWSPVSRLWQHALRQRMWRAVNSRVAAVHQLVGFIFGASAPQPSQPSDDDVEHAISLFQLLRVREHGGDDYQNAFTRAKVVLGKCDDLEALLQVTGDAGYNILQVAVMNGDLDFVELLVSEGCSVNRVKCSLPLHLACRLGNLHMVQYLLANGANATAEIGMCFPMAHMPTRHVPSRFHFLETDIYVCDSDHQLPVMYAIQGDHVDVVRCLMEGDGQAAIDMWPYRRLPLHHACKHGAFECMRYLISLLPEDVNEADDEGMTPLLYAVQWGKKYVELLINSGASISAANRKHQNALHLLYMQLQDPMQLYETTRFLLATGLEQDVERVDINGNTALHVVVTQLNRKLASFPNAERRGSSQASFDKQVIDTMELLLRHNCSPNIVNTSEITSLHKVILMFHFVISNELGAVTFETLPVREMYQVDLEVLHCALEVLFRHGAQSDAVTGAGRTALVMLLQSVLNMDNSLLACCIDDFVRCLTLLCDSGCHPSCNITTHMAIVTLLSQCGQKCLSQRTDEAKSVMSEFLKRTLAMLLRHGLNSNHCTMMRKRNIDGGSGNILIEVVKLAQFVRAPPDLLFIHDWVLTSLQWGANPDIEPYPSDSIICQSQSNIFLKPKATQPVTQYMYEIQDFRQIFDGGYCEKLLLLFYYSMDHDALFNCLSTAKYMARFDPDRSPSSNFIRMINNLSSQPRSLKQMTRVAIYKAIDRKLNIRVGELPLPKALQRYLVNVE